MPEKPILVFPSLAGTIGLEEAVLLSLLDELTRYRTGREGRGYLWYALDGQELSQHMPFWDDLDIQRVSQRLRDMGIILLLSAPYGESQQLKFAFNQQAIEQVQQRNTLHKPNLSNTSATIPTAVASKPASNKPAIKEQHTEYAHQHYSQNYSQNASPNSQRKPPSYSANQHTHHQGATLIAAQWQPDRETFTALSQLNIPEHFAREKVPEFVHYWRERGESQRSWGAKFIHHVQRLWTHHVAKHHNATTLPSSWQPSEELQQHIRQEGIPATFAQKSLQRFALYHKNSNTKHNHWDMPFFSWLKEDWEKQDTPFIDRKSSPMIEEWQPDQHTLTYLSTSQGIEHSFIEECIPEFIHKWIEKKAVYSEWGRIFAEHIIEQWRFVQAGVNKNPNPQLITQQWKPSPDCLEILETHSGIERDFIEQQIAEFILYWTNRAQPMHSWDNIFLRHVKHQWKQHYEKQQSTSGAGRTKDRTVSEQLTDRSWAS